MSGSPPSVPAPQQRVVSADGAMRALLVLLAAWTLFAGLALFTQGVGALSYGGGDPATQRILGAHLLILAPMYALLAWRPSEYRLLAWTPYAGQLAIVLPTIWDLVISSDRDFGDGAILFVVSLIFLTLLLYMRFSAHPPGFFEDDEDEDAEFADDEALEDETLDAGAHALTDTDPARGRRYRRS